MREKGTKGKGARGTRKGAGRHPIFCEQVTATGSSRLQNVTHPMMVPLPYNIQYLLILLFIFLFFTFLVNESFVVFVYCQ